jgi:hypothetical protein
MLQTNDDAGRVEFFPIKLRDRLPVTRIPLRSGDPVVALDLQTRVEQAYDKGLTK